MLLKIFYIYLFVVSLDVILYAYHYRRLDSGMKIILCLLIAIFLNENIAWIIGSMAKNDRSEQVKIADNRHNSTSIIKEKKRKNNFEKIGKAPIYNVYSVIEVMLVSLYFLVTVQPPKVRLWQVMVFVFWPVIGVLNYLYFQKFYALDTNLLILESCSIIPMGLFALYKILLDDRIIDVYKYPHFWIWALFLLLWCSSFFFWGCYEALIRGYNPYKKTFQIVELSVNILVYSGIGLSLLCGDKKQKI